MVPEQQQLQQQQQEAGSGGAQEPAAASPQQQHHHHHHRRSPPCASPGNPVFSCMLEAALLRARTGLPEPRRRLLHKTTSGDYGALAPTAQTAPCRYFPRDNALTDLLFACGKNQHRHGINTGLDKSRVCDHADIPNLTGGGTGVRLGRGGAAPTRTPTPPSE